MRSAPVDRPCLPSAMPWAIGRNMAKLSILVTSSVLSYAFWWAADAVGFDFMTAFVISGIGAIAGCVAGWKIYLRYLD